MLYMGSDQVRRGAAATPICSGRSLLTDGHAGVGGIEWNGLGFLSEWIGTEPRDINKNPVGR